jgi:predicted transcriptional regulator
MTPPAPAEQRATRLPPPGELEVLKVLWVRGEATVGEVRQELDKARQLAYTTVMTMLERLARKGVVTRRKKGRGYRYRAALSREAARRQALDSLLKNFFDNSPPELLRHIQSAPETEAPTAAAEQPLDSALL